MTRVFVMKAGEARTSGDFQLKDLPASSGRLDVVCRCAIASILGDEGIRRDTTFIAVLEGEPNPPLCIRFDGNRLKTMPFSEVAVAALLKRILNEPQEVDEEHQVPHMTGIFVEKKSFKRLLELKSTAGRIYYLHEEGEDIRRIDLDVRSGSIFVLGDQKGLPSQDEETLERLNARRVSVGPLSYISSHVITIVNDELDRRLSSFR